MPEAPWAIHALDSRPLAGYNIATMDPDDVIAGLMRRQLEGIGRADFHVDIGGDDEGAAIFTAVNTATSERFAEFGYPVGLAEPKRRP